MKLYEELKNKVLEIEQDVDKFFNKNNQAAGTRVRKAMQDIKELAQQLRKEVQETKNQAEAPKEGEGEKK